MEAYLAMVDQGGIRALLHEDAGSLRRLSQLCPETHSCLYCWAVMTSDVARLVKDLLHAGETDSALFVLDCYAQFSGPILGMSLLHAAASAPTET